MSENFHIPIYHHVAYNKKFVKNKEKMKTLACMNIYDLFKFISHHISLSMFIFHLYGLNQDNKMNE